MITKNDYKLLALDVDGTLLNSRHQLTERVRHALQRVAQRGVRVVLVSARSPASMMGFVEQIGSPEMVVALNGALVVGPERELLLRLSFAESVVEQLIVLAAEFGLSVHLYSGFTWYTEQMSPIVKRQIAIVGFRPQLGPFPPDIVSHIEKILVIGEATALGVFYDQVSRQGLAVAMVYSMADRIELTAPRVSKATGLAEVCRRLNIPARATIAVGDNHNDRTMIEFAGLGIAMGNAPAAVQAVAQVVIGSNDQDGVAGFVDKLFA